jgi:hypothetical protein
MIPKIMAEAGFEAASVANTMWVRERVVCNATNDAANPSRLRPSRV